MAISEPDRHHLYEAIKDQFDERSAATMMNLLPPTGWGDVARRGDIERFEVRLDRFEDRFDRLEATMTQRFDAQARNLYFSNAGLIVGLATLFFAFGR